LLVIFFMLAGVIDVAPPFPIAVPETHQDVDAEKGKATIFLSSDGDIAMPGGIQGREQVLSRLQILKADNKDFKVLIQADGRAEFLVLKTLTRELHNSGFTNISLLAAASGDNL